MVLKKVDNYKYEKKTDVDLFFLEPT